MTEGNVISFTTTPKRLPFELNGELFEAWQVPGLAFMELLGKIGAQTSEAEQAAVMFQVFQSTMTEEEFVRFSTFARNPANGVSADVLFKLISALVEGSAGRPTEQPSSSEVTAQNGEAG